MKSSADSKRAILERQNDVAWLKLRDAIFDWLWTLRGSLTKRRFRLNAVSHKRDAFNPTLYSLYKTASQSNLNLRIIVERPHSAHFTPSLSVEVGLEIKRIRESQNVPRATFARKLKMKPEQYHDIERGKADVPLSMLEKISDTLKHPITVNIRPK